MIYSPGHMKHFELDGKEILIANVEGRFYAMDDRCGHMNALLSIGNLKDTTLTCGFHGAQFEVTTGKKIGEPKKHNVRLGTHINFELIK